MIEFSTMKINLLKISIRNGFILFSSEYLAFAKEAAAVGTEFAFVTTVYMQK